MVLLIFVALQACNNSYRIDSAQSSLRSTFASRNFDQSVKLLDEYSKNEVYKSKDGVLLNLERGTANHFAGKYDSSNVFFSDAENQIDDLFTKSITRGMQSILANDNTLAYDGEDYEGIYLNIFKSLNYIHLNDLDAALVESRRISHKLGQLNAKYKGLAEALSKADTTGRADWKSGKTNVQNSALGHYLSAVLYAKTNNPDDARIAHENLLKAFRDQPGVYQFEQPEQDELNKITKPHTYNVLVTGFAGRAPYKRQNDVRLFLNDPVMYLKFSLPSLRLYPSQVKYVKFQVADTLSKPVPLIEEMDVVAKEVYKVKEPIIYARAFVRSFLKAAGTRTVSNKAEKKSNFLGGLAEVLGIVGQEVSEKADLRGWQTMPGKAHATVLELPPGSHEIAVNYYSKDGKLLFSDERTLNIEPNKKLQLIESLYWN
jgi:hypothetical protein